MSYNTKNYTEQGGEKTVIGGTLEIKEGASVTGFHQFHTSSKSEADSVGCSWTAGGFQRSARKANCRDYGGRLLTEERRWCI